MCPEKITLLQSEALFNLKQANISHSWSCQLSTFIIFQFKFMFYFIYSSVSWFECWPLNPHITQWNALLKTAWTIWFAKFNFLFFYYYCQLIIPITLTHLKCENLLYWRFPNSTAEIEKFKLNLNSIWLLSPTVLEPRLCRQRKVEYVMGSLRAFRFLLNGTKAVVRIKLPAKWNTVRDTWVS